ncbi:MAG: hypothetical protein JW976_04900 [Syntrophaceae bacterium]|nr:hypothetical protein [Syntrophaceae bacterium]
MDENSIIKENEKVYDLTDEIRDENNGKNQEVIVVDGRGYEDDFQIKKEINSLVDAINAKRTGDNISEEIIKTLEKITENIARKFVPEIAERVIKEEIEKLKKISDAE